MVHWMRIKKFRLCWCFLKFIFNFFIASNCLKWLFGSLNTSMKSLKIFFICLKSQKFLFPYFYINLLFLILSCVVFVLYTFLLFSPQQIHKCYSQWKIIFETIKKTLKKIPEKKNPIEKAIFVYHSNNNDNLIEHEERRRREKKTSSRKFIHIIIVAYWKYVFLFFFFNLLLYF